MKKIIAFTISTLIATQAFAGPYECQKECNEKGSQCVRDCERYQDPEWTRCSNACSKQAENCNRACER